MTTERDTGGPAFPSHGSMGEVVCDGMTLRDYAAIQFAAGMLANPAYHEYLHSHDERNRIALAAADSYLSERTK